MGNYTGDAHTDPNYTSPVHTTTSYVQDLEQSFRQMGMDFSPPPPPPPPPPSGYNGGDNNGGNGYTIQQVRDHGYHPCMTNLFEQDQRVRGHSGNYNNIFNGCADSDRIQTHKGDDMVFKGQGNPTPEPDPIIRFHDKKDRPNGRYHASPEEIARELPKQLDRHIECRYNIHAGADMNGTAGRAVQRLLDLPNVPKYFSMAIPTGSTENVTLSHTKNGMQQARISDWRSLEYKDTQPVSTLFHHMKLRL